ncbi:hypothetical protein PV328_008151 [Microctonus aethiopoides]|uniref:Odorant receptor n=1 Tax=Microctonus aethiopoides TaxID=144406 RepID=A0AA39CAS5_9HYME|nr:hypothetical protein PV328_008151 [Microctonus aethiopoides]
MLEETLIAMDNTKVSNSVDFSLYGTYVSIILSDAKMLTNNSQSTIRKFFGTFMTGLFLTLGVILIFSEMLDINNCYDLSTFATRMNPICYHLCGTTKWIHATMKVDEIDKIIRRVKRCQLISMKLNESDNDNYLYRMKMIKTQRKSAIFSGAYMTLLVYGTIRWCLNPIFYDLYNDFHGVKEEINSSFFRHLPYPGIIPWEIDNIYKYISTFALQAIASLGSGLGHAIYEIMHFTIILWTCSHLEYLSEALTNQRDNEILLNDDLAVQKFKNKLRHCMIHHRELLEQVLFDKLTQIMSTPMFIICSQSTLALCLVSLEISTMKIDGLNIADAIYMCDWEQAVNSNGNKYDNSDNDNREAKTNINQMIQFSLMRAQKPLIIKGGLFYTLSLETYKALTGFSLSNAVILRQVSNEE